MTQTNPTVEQHVPDCPYCDCPIDGRQINGLHPVCHEVFNAEMTEAFPEVQPEPQEPEFFPNLDEAACVF